MKKALAVMLSLCLACLASGCGPAVTRSRDESRPLTLNIASYFSGEHAAQTYQELSNRFAEDQGIDIVDSSTLTGDAFTQQIINDFAAGNEPDVFYFPVGDAQTMIDNNQVVSVQEICREYPQYAANIQSSIMDDLADENGNNWCVPVIGRYQALYCNVSLFETYGAPLPHTWGDLLSAIEIFKQNDVIPIAVGFKDQTALWVDQLILSYGVDEHEASPTDAADVPTTWNQALAQLVNLEASGAFPSNALTSNRSTALTLFNTQKAAMYLDFSDSVSSISIPNTVVASAFPCRAPHSGEDHLIIQVSYGYYISRKTWENEALRDAAVSFVMYMSSSDAIAHMNEDGGGYPTILLESLDPISGQGTLAQSALSLCRRAQAHYSMKERLSRLAWSSLVAAVEPIIQGYGSIPKTLDQLAINNRAPK